MPRLDTPIIFEVVGRPPYVSLWIDGVQADGTLLQTSLSDGTNDRQVSGTYDAVAGVIKFNDAEFPGLILTTTFFTANAIPLADGTVQSFVGSWTDQEITFEKTPKGKGHRMLRVRQLTGNWMAIHPQKPIQ